MERGSAPDAVSLADGAIVWKSAYVHIPMCARRCPYCDFAVVAADERNEDGLADRYVAAVLAEMDMEPEFGPLDSVYFGGGTPSRLPAASLAALLERLAARFGLAGDAEISLEANPEDWNEELGAGLVGAGFNRISFGAQSFDPGVLAALGRNHGPAHIESAVAGARASGFRSVNLDLIMGTPVESLDSWRNTVTAALALRPDHISAYTLTVERGTALSRAVASGAPAPDPDLQADEYELMQDAASAAGLVRYEVSNYAAADHPVRYNLSTWAQGDYVAFGLGAHGHRRGVRRRNVRRLDAYLAMVEEGRRPEAGVDRVADPETERLLLGIRRVAGVRLGEGGTAFVESAAGRRLVEAGVVSVDDERLRVVRPLLTDAVGRALLE